MTTETQIEAKTPLNIGTPLRNARRERFCLEFVGGLSLAEAARRAGYSDRYASTKGSWLATLVEVRIRLAELRDILASENIMSIAERKERLSEISRARLCDYHNERGVLEPLSKKAPNPGAVAEVQQEYDQDGREAYPTKIKLHDPVKAISELNKMERVYETGTTVNVNQNIVNVQVVTPKARKLTDKILEGERT